VLVQSLHWYHHRNYEIYNVLCSFLPQTSLYQQLLRMHATNIALPLFGWLHSAPEESSYISRPRTRRTFIIRRNLHPCLEVNYRIPDFDLIERTVANKRTFGPQSNEIIGSWNKLHNRKLHNLYPHQILLE
jgi:hypothetical protein